MSFTLDNTDEVMEVATGTDSPAKTGPRYLENREVNAIRAAIHLQRTRLRGRVSVLEFPGVDPTGVLDSTAGLQAAMTAATNGLLFFAPGRYRYTSPLKPPQGIVMEGTGPLFGCVLEPDGCAAFQILGAEKDGGWAFRVYVRDLMVEAKNAPPAVKLIEIDSAYSVQFDHVWVNGIGDSAAAHAYHINNCNDIQLIAPVVSGDGASGETMGVYAEGGSTVKIDRCDIEGVAIGIQVQDTSVVTVHDPYMEGVGVGVDDWTNGLGRTIIQGGRLSVVNDGAFPVRMWGNGAVYGTALWPGGGSNTHWAVHGWRGMYYDSTNKKLFLGDNGTDRSLTGGAGVSALSLMGAGGRNGIGLNDEKYRLLVHEAIDGNEGDLGLIYAVADESSRTLRLQGTAGATLSLYTDGDVTALGSISFSGIKIAKGTQAPLFGTWSAGDRVLNSAPAVGQPKGWVCTEGGEPGTWVSEGNL